jgi:MFS family permease
VQWYTAAVFWRGFQAFFLPIVATFGWSQSATAAAVSLQRTESGLISPFVGTLLDKFGPRKIITFGVFVTGGSFVFLSQVQNLWQYYLAVIMMTVGLSFGTFIVFVVSVGNWFVKKRARALATLMGGR